MNKNQFPILEFYEDPRSEVDRKFIREALFWFSVEASLEL